MTLLRRRLLSTMLVFSMLVSLMPVSILVENQVYADEGASPTPVALSGSSLPEGLCQTEYIASTSGGEQYIDLGFSPSQYQNILKSEIDLQYVDIPSGSGQGLGGCNSPSYYIIYGATANNFKMQSGITNAEVDFYPSDTNRHTFTMDQSKGTASVDNNQQSFVSNTAGITNNVALFTLHGSVNDFYSTVRIYSAKFSYYDAGTDTYVPIRNMVPCYATKDVTISGVPITSGTVGMYDTVQGKFYGNSGSGNFSLVVPSDIYYRDSNGYVINSNYKNNKYYMFLPATADFKNLNLFLPLGVKLTGSVDGKSIIIDNTNNGNIDVTELFGSMAEGTAYNMKASINNFEYDVVLIKSANIPSLYVTITNIENTSTGAVVTTGNPSTWLESYINKDKLWKATDGTLLMVNPDGNTVSQTLKSFKGRGNGSWQYGGEKKGYNIKLGKKAELVHNAGESKNWCLVSNYMTLPSHDSTGLANSTAYWLYERIGGDQPMKYQQADLYVNGVYRGTYSIVEKVEIDKERINLNSTEYFVDDAGTEHEKGISTLVNDPQDPAIAAGIQEYYYTEGTKLASQTSGGGILLELNDYYDEVCKFKTRNGVKLTFKEPEYATKEQVQQMAIYVQEFEDALLSPTGYNSKGKHYSEYADLESIAKKLILDGFMGNADSVKNSGYFHIDATTEDNNGNLVVNFSTKLKAGPAWDYDYWISFTDLNNLWTNNSCHGKIWANNLLQKGDFMDIMYDFNESTFKNALIDGQTFLTQHINKLTPSKTMEYLFMDNDFATKSANTVSNYNNRLNAWNTVIWNNSRLMGVTVSCNNGILSADINGTAISYSWVKLDRDHNATVIPGAVNSTYKPTEAGEYQVIVRGVSVEPSLNPNITMYSAPINVGDDRYTLTLDTRGGSLPNGTDNTVTVTPGGLYPSLPTPTKDGFSFIGWFTKPTGGVKIIENTASPDFGSDGTIYAQWKEKTPVQDIDSVTGAFKSSDTGCLIWNNAVDGSTLTGLILYGNEDGVAPTVKLSESRLPYGYQETEYIASTNDGHQWIDLGFSPSQYPNALKSEVKVKYDALPTGGIQSLGGCYSGNSYYIVYGATPTLFKIQSGGTGDEATWGVPDTEIHTFVLDQYTKEASKDNDVVRNVTMSALTSVSPNVALFAMKNTTSTSYHSYMNIYSAKFWYENRGSYLPLRDLVPCYTTADINTTASGIVSAGTSGLYDLVEGKFYTNSNKDIHSDFTVGPDTFSPSGTVSAITAPAVLYSYGDARDSYNIVTGQLVRRVRVENGRAVDALPESEWTVENYPAQAIIQYSGTIHAEYANGYVAPITAVYVPASVTLSGTDFISTGSEVKPTVTVTLNGSPLTENTDYTIKWPSDVISAGKKSITVTINTPEYYGEIIRSYNITNPVQEATPSAVFTATGPDTGTLSGVADGMMYSTNGIGWTDINSSADIDLTSLSACIIRVVKKGNGSTTTNSAVQEITVTKADTPSGAAIAETGYLLNDGSITITGYDSNNTYQISMGGIWNDVAPDLGGKITNLTPGSYAIRIKAKNTVLASDSSDTLIVSPYVRKSTKDITGFAVSLNAVLYSGSISGTAITLTVPYGSDVTSLTPSITHSGVGISPSGPQNFTSPVTYTVTAEDGSTQAYTVTITVSPAGKYNLAADPLITNGAVTFTPSSPVSKDSTVTLTVLPNPGYRLKNGTLKAYKSDDINTIVAISSNMFTMPGYDVVVTAEFEPILYNITFNANGGTVSTDSAVTDASGKLSVLPVPTHSGDYSFNGWFTNASGGTQVTTETVFSSDATIFAQWTDNSSGGGSGSSGGGSGSSGGGSGSSGGGSVSPGGGSGASGGGSDSSSDSVIDTPENSPFNDILTTEYYYSPVIWAVEKGITSGITPENFGPNEACTRAQMVTFLWRAAGRPVPNLYINPFEDVDPETYYYIALLWAYENGITTGSEKDLFNPDAVCTRAQTVTFLYRTADTPDVDAQNNFEDVMADAYYSDSVDWAVKQGITTGTVPGMFSPDDDCTRGQIVTFLYRAAH